MDKNQRVGELCRLLALKFQQLNGIVSYISPLGRSSEPQPSLAESLSLTIFRGVFFFKAGELGAWGGETLTQAVRVLFTAWTMFFMIFLAIDRCVQ